MGNNVIEELTKRGVSVVACSRCEAVVGVNKEGIRLGYRSRQVWNTSRRSGLFPVPRDRSSFAKTDTQVLAMNCPSCGIRRVSVIEK